MIELKITSESAAELAQHLGELAGRLFVTPVQHTAETAIMPEVAEAQQQAAETPKRTRRTKEQIAADNAAAEAAAEVAEAAVEQNAGEQSGDGATDAQPEESTVQTPATAALEKAAPPPTESAPLDFDKDVAPVVLGYVKSKGKPWVVGILAQFGVERASELPADRYGELVNALNDAAAE